MQTTLLAIFFALLAAGAPIFVSLIAVTALLYFLEGSSAVLIPQRILDEMNSPTLLAIPFFVMAAHFMQKGGVARTLIDLSAAYVGHMRGGLAVVGILTATIFSAISGSSVATALTIGSIIVPAMAERGYATSFSLGVVGAAGTLGILIPPSLALIIFSVLSDESLLKLFLAGVVPGLLQAAFLIIFIVVVSFLRGYPREDRPTRSEFVRRNVRSLPAMTLPVIILGGIYGGFVTVTEAAALSALAALFFGLVVYRGFRLAQVPALLVESVKSSGSILLIVAAAGLLGHWITDSGIPQVLVEWMTRHDLQRWQFLLAMNLILLVLGMFLESISIMIITLPLILPMLGPLGIDPLHFAIIMVVNQEIGLLTPPLGMNLFVLTGISRGPLSEAIEGAWPFVVVLLGLLAIITFVPEITLWLPNLVYGQTPAPN